MKPDEIERSSFQIIDQEAGTHHFTGQQWSIVRRMIHTTADFEFKEMVRFHPHAVSAGIEAIRNGKMIITDTNMARVGIRKKEVETYGGRVKCYMDDPLIHKRAQTEGGTRAKAAVDAAVPEMKDGIYVVGNAPTALLRLIELVVQKKPGRHWSSDCRWALSTPPSQRQHLWKWTIPIFPMWAAKGAQMLLPVWSMHWRYWPTEKHNQRSKPSRKL
jgi:precorrin-8X/cobalt-precorrin-8 methylmutase